MRSTVLAALLSLATLALPGCYSKMPTTGTSINVVVKASIDNASQQPSLIEADMVFDGTVIGTQTAVTSTAAMVFSTAGASTTGSHTMAFVIIKQNGMSNNYTVVAPDVQVFDAAGNFLKDVQLPTMTQNLITDGSITYSFTI